MGGVNAPVKHPWSWASGIMEASGLGLGHPSTPLGLKRPRRAVRKVCTASPKQFHGGSYSEHPPPQSPLRLAGLSGNVTFGLPQLM